MAAVKKLIDKCTGGGAETPQFLILGLEGCGKTTLLYRLKLGPVWPDMTKDLAEMRTAKALDENFKARVEKIPEWENKFRNDREFVDYDGGHHYEELEKGMKHGMWEIPGTPAMRQTWASLYHAIKIHGIIFVVDSKEDDEDRIALSKRLLHFLMNEDELRPAAFAVIINQRKRKGGVCYDEKEDKLQYKLGLHELHPSCDWRVKKFVLNVNELRTENDSKWAPVIEFMKATLTDPRGHGIKF
eukprot:gnl/TRDRNA2_/TRDRNA2_28700_c0_seq1.p1 gnl/TRDRNA2_/TRDRNA2_28700_c0~~gnl/TRDRNA2_/TRDRNA2_28700_c0_seq1.p1  ORF type:complete len:274 (-),score=45.12 gnl/TRDRNA2_/TRDRNA2_28700_c0_seq1:35-763(-)